MAARERHGPSCHTTPARASSRAVCSSAVRGRRVSILHPGAGSQISRLALSSSRSDKGAASGEPSGSPPVEGEVEGHWLSWTWLPVGCSCSRRHDVRHSQATVLATPMISLSTSESSGHSKSGPSTLNTSSSLRVSRRRRLREGWLILPLLIIVGDAGSGYLRGRQGGIPICSGMSWVDEGVGVRGLCGIIV